MAQRLVVRTERRHGWMRAGGVAIAVGVLMLLAGAATAWLAQATQVARAADRAELPHALRFEGEGGRYQLILLADPALLRRPYRANAIAQMACTVDRPDETTERIDLSRATSRTETELGEQMAAFETTPGRTTVRCDFADGRASLRYFYVVARSRKVVANAAFGLLIGGVLLTCAGAAALAVGLRGRAVVQRRDPA